jgi:glutamate 5-kinase
VRWVVKVGSSTLVDEVGRLRRGRLTSLARQVAHLRQRGIRPALVVSGAVALGRRRLEGAGRPGARAAAAALGQPLLVAALSSALEESGLALGEILLPGLTAPQPGPVGPLTALDDLLEAGAVPVINGNDAAAPPGADVPDNDSLAASVARAWPADLLVILTDQEGLLTADPRYVPQARLVPYLPSVTPEVWARVRSSRPSTHGRGGMESKLLACAHAAGAGIPSVIAAGHQRQVLVRLAAGEHLGTRIGPWPGLWERGA